MKKTVINPNTGEVKKYELATQNQVKLLKHLYLYFGYAPVDHSVKTVWVASRQIKRLLAKKQEQEQKLKIFDKYY